MADEEEWASNANEAVDINLIQAGVERPKQLSSFHPNFTYPIFGEEESIFGYQGLQIKLRFAAHDLRSNVEVSYDKRFKAVGETRATDILGILKEWMPEDSFGKSSDFDYDLQTNSGKDFTPPGKLLESYTSKGRSFEIWSGELRDPAVKQLIDRMQVFISFFIEGGTPLELEDQEWTLARWRVYFVYEKLSLSDANTTSPYSIVGYSTSYRFITYTKDHSAEPIKSFDFPPTNPILPSDLLSRVRISQFLILPSHHSHGHGTRLYNAMVSTFLASPTITEITVEDPNEAFDDLRDYCDYSRLLANKTLSQVKLNTGIDPKLSMKRSGIRVPTAQLLNQDLLEKLRTKNKIAPRQFYRLVEMYLLSQISPHARQSGTARLTQRGKTSNEDDRAFFYWRLLVKQRIYKKNRDVLIQLDRLERAEKVEQTVGEVAGDYERLLREMAGSSFAGDGKEKEREDGEASSVPHRAKKRKVLDDDDDDDDNSGGGGGPVGTDREENGSDSKRAKSEVL